MIPIIYYAHSLHIYGTEQEISELQTVQMYFYHGLIFNPNRPSVQFASDPMKACVDVVKDEMVIGLVFSEFHEEVEQGVYAEVQCAKKHGKPIFLLRNGIITGYLHDFTPLRRQGHYKVKR